MSDRLVRLDLAKKVIRWDWAIVLATLAQRFFLEIGCYWPWSGGDSRRIEV